MFLLIENDGKDDVTVKSKRKSSIINIEATSAIGNYTCLLMHINNPIDTHIYSLILIYLYVIAENVPEAVEEVLSSKKRKRKSSVSPNEKDHGTDGN